MIKKSLSENIIRVENSILSLDKKSWDKCANPKSRDFNPFIGYEFLKALELSGSINGESGWLSSYITLLDNNNNLKGCIPSYIKNNSMGEYVFDYSWAEAYARIGGSYYPKIQISIPFTPATTQKLLTVNNDLDNKIKADLVSGICDVTKNLDCSSAHITFISETETKFLKDLGWLIRTDQQFHWNNYHYRDFQDFLDALSSRKRKNIKKERSNALKNSVNIEILHHKDIKTSHWDHFFNFYINTSMRKWGHSYLTREFFAMIGDNMSENILLVMAKRKNKYIAGALNFIGNNILYGRNWGAVEDHKYLHFEVCYYQAIEYAIKNNLKRVEAGAQGPHKIARGYEPQITHSAHWIRDLNLSNAVSEYLKDERKFIQENINILGSYTPFKKN